MYENESLYFNLTHTLHALQKLRESRRSIPTAIDEHLAKMSDSIILCQCACVDEEARFSKTTSKNHGNWETYAYVLNTLLATSNGAVHTLLQLYFRKSPYWEHYYRNMMEIVALLNYNLYRMAARIGKSNRGDDQQIVGERKKRMVSSYFGDFANEEEEEDGTKFRRKFLTLSKLPAWRPRPSLVH